ncbi:pesticidal protein Cry7Aa [Flavobacterium sp.]|uniref:glycoside hydrolase family 130 protein n=1 Tax=Flavobacterium sp. TaxID=239 RepID=UPI002613A2D1|nr:pesticidal protein Cry7Aa [Flavobacterium sp.]
MIKVYKHGIVLEKTDLSFENDSVLNPAVMQEGTTLHMLYRAVRNGNYSTVGYCKLDGPLTVVERNDTPLLIPLTDDASKGVEDPRIVKIDGVYYITYTAYNGINALGALVTSTDLKTFERQGIIVPKYTFDQFKRLAECNNLVNVKYFRHVRHFEPNEQIYLWDKDVMFFPRKIDGKLAFLHRIRPGIQLVMVTDLKELTKEYWDHYFLHFNEHIILDPVGVNHESGYIGAGAPPIETELGWLLIYHGVYDTSDGYIYSAAAALLDIDNPTKVIARLIDPLFVPEFDYEINGVVNNVVFPTGTALFDDELYIYYGAADKCIACASVSLKALLEELLLNKIDYES